MPITPRRFCPVLLSLALAAARHAAAQPARDPASPPAACEGCGAADAPSRLTASARIAPAGEPGTPLVVTGVVYHPDGRTPAAGVLVYAYHTNATGVYPTGPSPSGRATGHARRHGALRGWLRTDTQGQYRFTTIRPAPYPSRDEPAHIHLTVTPPGGRERWIDVIVFDDDPLLTPRRRAALENVGGSGLTRVTAGTDGVAHVVRDIRLECWP